MSAPGYALCVWSNPEGCWASIAVSEDRARIDSLAVRLSLFTELRVRVLVAESCGDDDIVEASSALEPPGDLVFLRPDMCH